MEKNIDKILAEIYALDSDLKAHEPQLRKIIIQIIEARPDTKFDEKFARELRAEVLKRAKVLKAGRAEQPGFWAGFLNLPKFAYVLGGAAIALVVMIPFLPGVNLTQRPDSMTGAPIIGLGEGVKKLDSQAFGFLGLGGDGPGMRSGTEALGLGGGDKAAAAPMAAADIGFGGGGIMPPYEAVSYRYVYAGDEIVQNQTTMDVYRPVRTDAGSQALAQYVSGLNFSLVDLKKFNNLKITNLNIVEDREYGYNMNLNMAENAIDIFMNWEKWPRPENQCRDERCFAQYRIGIEDVPANETVIAMANKFLSDYNINRRGYGEPVVIDNWKRLYEAAENKADFYVPEDMTVVYPLIVEGETVYDAGGAPNGLYVTVNIRHNRVSGVNSIKTNSFESSPYPAITAAEEIIRIAERGGLYPDWAPEQAVKTVEVRLGTPKTGLVRYWSYDSAKGTGEELLVPFYIFPVVNLDEIRGEQNYFYRENVVVPMIKEIADQIKDQPIGILYDTPAMRPETADSPDAPVADIEPSVLIDDAANAASPADDQPAVILRNELGEVKEPEALE